MKTTFLIMCDIAALIFAVMVFAVVIFGPIIALLCVLLAIGFSVMS